MKALKVAKEMIAEWRINPVKFVTSQFGVEPDDWQIDFLNAYNTNRRVAAKACKGPGKTAVLAWCAWHFLMTRPFPKIAATSITGDNLSDGLWTEMAKWQQKSRLLTETFEWTKTRIYARDHPETWWMAARQWSKTADTQSQANTLAGLHADNIMFILDEAGGIPDGVMAAAEAVLANEHSDAKILICGNPTHLEGPLYRACTQEASLWKVIEITGDPDDPKRSKRISIRWAREMIQKYGATNPWVLVNVFGRFPPASLNALLGPDDLTAAMKRILPVEAYNSLPKILGVDVALQGGDRTVIAPRQGLACFKPKILREPNPLVIAGAVAVSAQKWGADAIFVDNTGGWGSGVVAELRRLGYEVVPVQFSSSALDPVYYNKRAEMAFNFAQAIKYEGVCLPDFPELKEEACAITYTHKGDRFILEDKDIIKEKLGRSPDIFDAYSITYAFPVAKRDPYDKYRKQESGDYDPVKRHYRREDDNKVDEYNPLS